MTLLPSNPHFLIFLFFDFSCTTGYGPPRILKKNTSKLNLDPALRFIGFKLANFVTCMSHMCSGLKLLVMMLWAYF